MATIIMITAATIITMTDAPKGTGLLKLMTWLSPAFPVGSFSYSHGLESAAASSGPIADQVTPTPSPSPQGGREQPRRPLGLNRQRLAQDGSTAKSPSPLRGGVRGGGTGSPAEEHDRPVTLVSNADDLRDWLITLLRLGSGWNDAILFADAWRRQHDGGDIVGLAELGVALAGSHERHLETTLQGAAFVTALRNGWPEPPVSLPDPCPYPVAVGVASAAHGIVLETALAAYLQAFVANLAQASIRLGVTGQAGTVGLVAALEPVVAETAQRAAQSSLDDLGSAAILSDIMSMRHETHYSRLFRT